MPAVLAQETSVYLINSVVFNNDTVTLKEINIVQGSISHFPEYDTGYKVKIYSNSQNLFTAYLPVTFIRTVSPPMPITPLNNVELSIRLPYFSNADSIFFYHGENTILKISLQKNSICGNNICETYLGENYINCPQDCPSGTTITTTTTSIPEITTTTTVPVEKTQRPVYIYLIITGIIIAAIALLLLKVKVVK